MATQSLIKQPGESRLYKMDFAPLLAVGETITSIASITSTPTGLTVSASAFDGVFAEARISAGTDGVRYKLTFVVGTSASNILESEGVLQVKNL